MLNNLECPAIPELADDCKKSLGRLKLKEITPEQFEVEICEISCKHKECIVDFRWRPEPTPPEEYTRYRSLSPKDKKIFLDQNSDFFIKGKIPAFLDAKDVVTALNKRNLGCLLEWFKLVGISAAARLSVEKMINTFSGRMGK